MPKEFQGGVWRVVYRTKKDYHLPYKHHVAIVVAIVLGTPDAAMSSSSIISCLPSSSHDYLAKSMKCAFGVWGAGHGARSFSLEAVICQPA